MPRKTSTPATVAPVAPAPSFLRTSGATDAEILQSLVSRFLTGRAMPDMVNGRPLLDYLGSLRMDRTPFRSTDTAARIGCSTIPPWTNEVALTLRSRILGN